jgi:hypothetical protein
LDIIKDAGKYVAVELLLMVRKKAPDVTQGSVGQGFVGKVYKISTFIIG